MRPTKSSSWFTNFAKTVSRATGRPAAFAFAVGIIIAWLASRPLFESGDTWQLVINTGTTVVTFLMVFLMQSTQNRDTEALQVKIDELIRVTEGAHTALLDLEELEESEFDAIRQSYLKLARKSREDARRGKGDTGRPEI